MAKKNPKTEEKYIPFVRNGSRGVETVAVVRTKVRKGMTTQEFLMALTQVVTSWCKGFDDGRECWDYSCGDLNIGDLSSYMEGFLSTEGEYLESLGIFEFELVCIFDNAEAVPFDTVLADASELTDEEV